MDMTSEIIEMLRSGDLDDSLTSIHYHTVQRARAIGNQIVCGPTEIEPPPEKDRKDLTPSERMEQNFNKAKREGKKVKVVGRLKPNYLYGHSFRIVKVNPKRVRVAVPDQCKFCGDVRMNHITTMNGQQKCQNSGRYFSPKYGRFTGASAVDIPKTALLIDDA